MSDFLLHDGVEVVSVTTVVNKNLAKTKKDIRNMLITYMELKEIKHDKGSPITYNRLNHLDFKYEIQLRNKNKLKKKVFVRIWLGFLTNKTDLR